MEALNNFLFFVLFILCARISKQEIALDDIQGYYWRDYKGNNDIPNDALAGGTNENGNPTYIGQVLHRSLLIPAKIDPEKNQVAYEWGYKEFVTNINVKIFCTRNPEDFEWLHTGHGLIENIDADLLVIGGYEPGAKIYVGRKEINGSLVLGKIIQGSNQATLNTSKDGVGTQHAEFDVLSYNPKKKSTTKRPPAIVDLDVRIPGNEICNRQPVIITVYN